MKGLQQPVGEIWDINMTGSAGSSRNTGKHYVLRNLRRAETLCNRQTWSTELGTGIIPWDHPMLFWHSCRHGTQTTHYMPILYAYAFTSKNSFVERKGKFLPWLHSTCYTILETFHCFLVMQIQHPPDPPASIVCITVLLE